MAQRRSFEGVEDQDQKPHWRRVCEPLRFRRPQEVSLLLRLHAATTEWASACKVLATNLPRTCAYTVGCRGKACGAPGWSERLGQAPGLCNLAVCLAPVCHRCAPASRKNVSLHPSACRSQEQLSSSRWTSSLPWHMSALSVKWPSQRVAAQ